MAAAVIGAWLLGTALMWFVVRQSVVSVERTMNSAAPPVIQMAQTRQQGYDLLVYGAAVLNRRLSEMWEMLQLGFGAALIGSSILTRHRSRFLIVSAILMTAIVMAEAFALTPALHVAQQRVQFEPGSLQHREKLGHFRALHIVFESAKTLLGIAIALRLVVNWKTLRSVVRTDVVAPVSANGRAGSDRRV
jgi:hypothetical protein